MAAGVFLDFNLAGLTGQLPNTAGIFGSRNSLYYGYFHENSLLTGILPSTFLSSIRAQASTTSSTTINIKLVKSGLTGNLRLPNYGDVSIVSFAKLTLDASNTRFTSVSFPNGTSGLQSLHIGNNPALTGSIPSSLFQLNPALTQFTAPATSLNGAMPDMGALNPGALKALDLSDTDIDFCSGDRDTWTSSKLTSCVLRHTSAYNCITAYPSSCLISAPPPSIPIAPVSQAPIEPVLAPPVSISVPYSAPETIPSTPIVQSAPGSGPSVDPVTAPSVVISEPTGFPTSTPESIPSVGPIPSSFFDIPYCPSSFSLTMSGNNLGSLPTDLFDQANFTRTGSLTLDFSNAGLTGQMPNSAGVFGTSNIIYIGNFNDNNMMTGTLPSTFLSSIRRPSGSSLVITTINFNVANTGLTGDLAVLDLGDVVNQGFIGLYLDASNSSFTSISFPNGTSGLRSLTISNNPTLTGSLPGSLFELNPKLQTLSAFNTKLSGTMPDMGTLNPSVLTTLDLSDTDIDFCSGDRITWIDKSTTFKGPRKKKGNESFFCHCLLKQSLLHVMFGG